MAKTRALPNKCGQNNSGSVAVAKTRALPNKCGQNCANLLCRNIISRASPENDRLEAIQNSFNLIKLIKICRSKCTKYSHHNKFN